MTSIAARVRDLTDQMKTAKSPAEQLAYATEIRGLTEGLLQAHAIKVQAAASRLNVVDTPDATSTTHSPAPAQPVDETTAAPATTRKPSLAEELGLSDTAVNMTPEVRAKLERGRIRPDLVTDQEDALLNVVLEAVARSEEATAYLLQVFASAMKDIDATESRTEDIERRNALYRAMSAFQQRGHQASASEILDADARILKAIFDPESSDIGGRKARRLIDAAVPGVRRNIEQKLKEGKLDNLIELLDPWYEAEAVKSDPEAIQFYLSVIETLREHGQINEEELKTRRNIARETLRSMVTTPEET